MIMQKPTGIGSDASEYWDEMNKAYSFAPGEFLILKRICVELTVIEQLEDNIDFSNLRVTGYAGQEVPDPLLVELRQHTATLNNLIKTLKLPEAKASRSEINRANAMKRWDKR